VQSLQVALVNTTAALLANDPNLNNFELATAYNSGQLSSNATVTSGSAPSVDNAVLASTAVDSDLVQITMWFTEGRWDVRVEVLDSAASDAAVVAFGD